MTLTVFWIGIVTSTTRYVLPYLVCDRTSAAFLPAINTTSLPVNLSRSVSRVVFTTHGLGATRNFPICDLHL